MSGKQPTDIDRQIAAATELRELTRDAHAAIKDLRPLIRDGNAAVAAAAAEAVAAQIAEQVRIQLGGLEERVAAAITEATGKVLAGFRRLR